MKQKFLPIAFLCGSVLWGNLATATETEPNDDRASANTLALNGNNNGKINSAGDQDWWKITTTGDGRLDISLTPLSGKYVWIYLYDNNGTTQLNAKNDNKQFTASTDGLAAGTYYVKVVCYYNTDTGSYTISNTLTPPAEANDVEPDSTRNQALTLALNGSATGHVGYYYTNHRDTVDWYKVTTNADGRLRLSLTPANNKYVWVYLYDNNGTTLLNSSNNNIAFNFSTDGLAAGTYYIKVNCFYYNTDFAPYTLSDSLFTPVQANDIEPKNTKATAQALVVNKSKTGHVGYYYNVQRDTTDWYKITTKTDGQLRLSLTPANGKYVWIYLYDNNGTTLLNSNNNNVPFSVSTDGLAAGTYYVKINCYYYNTDFAPYTLSDSLFTYANAVDAEPDNKPYLAKTMPANGVVTGHVGFYYNNARDTSDWWKINYTGTGPLSVTVKFEPNKNSSYRYTWMDIYKDTLSAPLYSHNDNTSTMVANLNALTQGYYYVRIRMYYNSEFTAYSLTDTFTQVNIASVKVTSYDTAASCSLINTISFTCSNSSAPYTVKLYRYGVLFSTKTARVKSVTFDTLPIGSYYAKAWGDGATGTASGKSKNVNIVPTPTGLSTTGISATQATLNWTPVACAKFDSIYYRVHGTTTWTKRNTTGNPASFVLTGLAASTTYDWEIAAVDSANGIIARGAFSGIVVFATPAAFASDGTGAIDALKTAGAGRLQLTTLPNPATSSFKIQFGSDANSKVTAVMVNLNGKSVWSSGLTDAGSLNGKVIITNQFSNGVYYLRIMNEQGELTATAKVVVAK
jgi:hypothetical protein